jgi:hypothetical protein
LDDSILQKEFERRFVHGRAWNKKFTSPQNQALCWLAECNKRMFGSSLDQRAKQRDILLGHVTTELDKAATAPELCELLDIAYRSVFYGSSVKPQDGAKAIFDLFKQYVGHESQAVHDYACKYLRIMGTACFDHHDEVLQFLIEHAPELRKELTLRVVPGIKHDVLLGEERGPFESDEQQFLRIDDATPSELADVAKRTLKGGDWVESVCGSKAIEKLIVQSCKHGGEESSAALSSLIREGIKFHDILWQLSSRTVMASDPAEVQASQQTLDEALKAYREMPQENWPVYERKGRAEILDMSESLRHVLKEASEESLKRVEQQLSVAQEQIRQSSR